MRLLAAIILCASPATAWEFTETDVCILSHSDPAAEVTIIYDPAQPLYTITLTRPEKAWPAGPDFRIRFDGNRPISIGTTRQVISDAGRTVSVSDVGFGNVLDGVELKRQSEPDLFPQAPQRPETRFAARGPRPSA